MTASQEGGRRQAGPGSNGQDLKPPKEEVCPHPSDAGQSREPGPAPRGRAIVFCGSSGRGINPKLSRLPRRLQRGDARTSLASSGRGATSETRNDSLSPSNHSGSLSAHQKTKAKRRPVV